MFCVLICYVMPGCFALSRPKNFSAQSDPLLFCASDNKRFELEIFLTTSRNTITELLELQPNPAFTQLFTSSFPQQEVTSRLPLQDPDEP